jgi:hypothetical protein
MMNHCIKPHKITILLFEKLKFLILALARIDRQIYLMKLLQQKQTKYNSSSYKMVANPLNKKHWANLLPMQRNIENTCILNMGL